MTEKPKRNQAANVGLFLVVGIAVAIGIALVLVFTQVLQPRSTGLIANATPSDFTGITAIEPAQDVADFTLTDQNGEPMSLSETRGKLTLVFFGFTHCPDLCPTTLSEFRKINETIGAEKVNFVFISVDGERDTPEVMKQHLETSRVPYVIGLTEDLATVLEAGKPFNLVAEAGQKDTAGNYDMIHSSSIFVLNSEGQLVAKYAYGTLLDEMIKDIQARL